MAIPLKDIQEAYERVKDVAHETPVMTCTAVDDAVGGGRKVFFKCEHLQKIGAFKIRGAVNAVTRLKEEVKDLRAVVTHSSGNHAQALALAGKIRGVDAHIVMPRTAPAVKVAAVRDTYKAKVYICDSQEARQPTSDEIVKRTNGVFIHPYNHRYVQTGQGTAGYEFMNQMSCDLDAVVIAIGGGGMFTGMASAIKAMNPKTKVFGAEPLMANDAYRSFMQRERVVSHLPGQPATMADGLLTLLAPSTYEGVMSLADGIITVSEKEISSALRLVMERMKQVIEPSAAVPLAALMSSSFPSDPSLKRIGVVLCGGNIDLESLPKLLNVAKM
eukprot:TRINITY_DN1121_c0_g2_i1.p2 TRINITY_DN1121_c0_g2~~TRINITY_DN1121_c0_g2_i1.p2  ORF type:complete len:330 (+),score=63.20 TRINITY_DN1121_c0_g2_i1:60-1049(+)